MKIIQLTAENIKRLIAVEIRPDGHLVQITGKNGAGKTSVLDSIWWALSGAKHVQAAPIRRGANSAKIKLDMGEILVTRTFKRTDDGGFTTKLDVVGNVKGTPQTMLDSLLNSLAFDPLEFARWGNDAEGRKKQISTLQSYVPDVDFDALAAANSIDFANRAEKNRKAKEARIQADQFVITDKTPTERIDESALVQQLADAGTHNANVQMRGANRQQMTIDIAAKKSQAVDLRTKADELVQQAERLEAEAQASQERLEAAPPLPDLIDVTIIQQQIADARLVNAQVDRRERKSKFEQEAITAESEAKQLTSRMEAREAQKRQAIAAAKLPVEGISFTDEAIMLNGVPFDQASDAEQLRISCAIAMAGNPKLRVIRVRDGSLLDEESLGILAKMAEERDYQVWCERVEPGKVGFIIEDGMVKAEAVAEEK
ncbi:MAG TPA: AAA family ATPase [Terriglobia bacterium]|nr:AAA family ATPase [Terriglobia bacterium]